jgi:amidohydrolase
MNIIERIRSYQDELVAIRRDLHAHPEIGFEEERTSGIVAERLASWGIEVHRGIGKTGVVGVLRSGSGNARRIGLRADMDALPIQETTGLPFASQNPGRMHACGHDGHTTMLLGAARYLAETRNFEGTAIFVFQPAEEGLGGARAMIADGLFQRFPVDEIYGLHNSPDGPRGRITVKPGPAMAAADFFDISIQGRGSHAAYPHKSADPVVIAMTIGQALQTVVSRNADATAAAVLSITQIHAGSAYSVIPDTAHLAGTMRTLDDDVRAMTRTRLREIAQGIAASFGASAEVDIRDVFSVLRNNPEKIEAVARAAGALFGETVLERPATAHMGSEDFADMLLAVPGAYCWLGMKGAGALHNPNYEFDDEIIPLGASLLARLVEQQSAAEA